MKVFVTGATGFIGRRLVGDLRARGDEVTALVRREDPTLDCPQVVGDLANVPGFSSALPGMDAVIHGAALVDPIDDERAADAINHRATIELARAARAHGVPTMAFMSSVMAIGFRPGAGLVAEDTPCAPANPYGRSKRAAELGLLALDDAALRVVVVRPPTVYGRGDVKGNFLGLTRAVDTGAFLVPGDGENRMSFCHVANLTAALRALVASPEARGIYHVGDDPPVTLRGAVETIAAILGRRLLPIPFPMPAARALAVLCDGASLALRRPLPFGRVRLRTITSDFAFDTARLRGAGYAQVVSFQDGARDAIAFYRERGLVRRSDAG